MSAAPDTLRIRRASPADAPRLAALNRFVHELHVRHHPERFKPTNDDEVAAWFAGVVVRAGAAAWIAELGPVPAGYVLVFANERAETPFTLPRRSWELDQIAVDPGHRRRGVAKALVEHVLAEARAAGVPDVELTAWAFNDEARRTFERLGFRPMLVRYAREASG